MLGACRHEKVKPLLGLSADRSAGLQDGVSGDAARLLQRQLAMTPGAPENVFDELTWQQQLVVSFTVPTLHLQTSNTAP